MFNSYSFDFSIQVMFVCLLNGSMTSVIKFRADFLMSALIYSVDLYENFRA